MKQSHQYFYSKHQKLYNVRCIKSAKFSKVILVALYLNYRTEYYFYFKTLFLLKEGKRKHI